MNQAAETLSVVIERELQHPPEKIWRALTQPHLGQGNRIWILKGLPRLHPGGDAVWTGDLFPIRFRFVPGRSTRDGCETSRDMRRPTDKAAFPVKCDSLGI